MGRFSKVVPDPNSNDYPKYFGLSGTALSRMIGIAAGSGFVSISIENIIATLAPHLSAA